ncbi:MAG: hypothetical protein E7410_00825 [Ruminococcaceae bacterium]|nr:hypothetical protein [Oscillospiraceae bacterium]
MNNKSQLLKLEKCIENGNLCAINREFIDTFSLYGYPVYAKGELAVISFVYDFMPDGYKIIRKSDITDVFSGKAEQFLDKVVKGERPSFKADMPDLKLDNMISLCTDLMKKEKLVTIECEDFEENIILIGQIMGVEKNIVSIKTFDGLGVWDKECSSVSADDITCISVGNSYVNIISKYLTQV